MADNEAYRDDPLRYCRAIYEDFDDWPAEHRFVAILAHFCGRIDLTPLLEDLINGVPEHEPFWRDARRKNQELGLKTLKWIFDSEEQP